MRRVAKYYQKYNNYILMILGLLAVSLIVLPHFLLGEGSYVEIHDQLDGEVLNYIYRARYWLVGDTIPEFMNGMSKASMAMPAPFGIVFYRLLPPFYAFTLMQWMGVLVGFCGMFLLCDYFDLKPEISFLIAILFAYMPFYPVYGLAAYGQPLLVLCFLQIREEKKWLASVCGIVIYGGFSSLTLVGYVWVALGAFYVLALCIKNRRNKRALLEKTGKTFTGWLALTITYLLTNLDLLSSISGNGFQTHRVEMVLKAGEHPVNTFLELILKGGAYSKTYAPCILVVCILCLAVILLLKIFRNKKTQLYEYVKGFSFVLLSIFIFSTLATLWNTGWIVTLRKTIGGIAAYFQADRVYWIFPFLWMMVLALLLQSLWLLYKSLNVKTSLKRKEDEERLFWPDWKKRVLSVLVLGIAFFLYAAEGAQILRDSTLNKNMRLLLLPNYQQMTWESFFMDDVFARIDEIIGQEKEQVSTLSIGMYPSIALYHSYTCADGYSNNYSLEYKHKFRRIFAGELEKNASVKAYFDDWGNRLYLASAQYGFDTLMARNSGKRFEDLSLDTEAMKALNVKYLFSAAPIDHCEEIGLEQVGDNPISSETGFYEVWLYKVK